MSKIIFPAFIIAAFLLISEKIIAQSGTDCNDPHIINSIPFVQTGLTTQGFGNDYTSSSCCTSVYMTGNDYVFKYTPADTIKIRIELENTGAAVGLFVTKGCPDSIGAECTAIIEASNGNPVIYSVELLKDTTYYIIVSTYNMFGLNSYTAFDIYINYSYPKDVEIRKLYYPRSGCEVFEDVNLFIENIGTDTVSNFDVAYTIDGGAPVVKTCTFIIPPGAEQNISFWGQEPDLSIVGHTYHLEVYTMLPGDGNPENDTLKRNITHTPDINTFPYYEDFESGSGGWAADWINSSISESSWEIGTPAAPIINTAHSGSNSWATNLDGFNNPDEKSFVISPCFDFSGMVLPILDFWIWYETMTWDYIAVEYSTDSSMTWTQLGNTATGQNWYNTPTGQQYAGWHQSSGGWLNAIHTCDGMGGLPQVQFRFYFEGGVTDLNEGFAFDDFRIYESPLNDLKAVYIDSPVNACSLGTENITIAVSNQGLYEQFGFDIFYSTDGGGSFISQTITDTIYTLDTLLYTFSTPADFSANGLHDIVAGVSHISDENSGNDTLNYSFFNFVTVGTFPYFEDFETSDGGWYANGIESTWEHGIPTDSVIDTAYSGTHIWVTNLSGYHNEGEQSYLYSPCFDFSALVKPRISFAVWYEVEIVGTQLEVSIDGGLNWDVYGGSGEPGWYNQGYNWINHSGGWLLMQHDLYSLAGQSQVQFRFKFTGIMQFSGFALDAFEICEAPVAGFDYAANGLEVTLMDISSNSDSYYWDFGDQTQSTEQSPVHIYSIGDTTVLITQIVYNDCYSDTSYANVYVTGIPSTDNNNLVIFPNPATDFIYIEMPDYSGQISLLEIYSSDGILISSEKIKDKTSVNVKGFNSGIYYLRISSDNEMITKKIIKL